MGFGRDDRSGFEPAAFAVAARPLSIASVTLAADPLPDLAVGFADGVPRDGVVHGRKDEALEGRCPIELRQVGREDGMQGPQFAGMGVVGMGCIAR